MRGNAARHLLHAAVLLVVPAATPAQDATYTSAEQCAACHDTIHQYWSESAHARSVTRPGFLDAFRSAPADPAAWGDCVWCHAPTTLVTGDTALEGALAREGVTCDFCHTVTNVDLGRPDEPFELRPGDVKLGPLQYTADAPHGTEYSTLHRSSALLCAGCHDYRNANGVAVLTAYTEWSQSPYAARGKTCQECHMPLVPGSTVTAGLESSQRVINLHRTPGGSFAAKLAAGLELEIESFRALASSAEVRVVVRNSGAGHSVPGGLSTKSLALVVGVDSGSGALSHTLEQIYQRELLDAEGNPLSDVPAMFLKAAAVGEDTRIPAGQSRSARFTLPLPDDWKAVVARLEYRDHSGPGVPQTILIREERRERR
jgi:Cytochrome c554 and c-prime